MSAALTFLGGVGTVTGSKYLLEVGAARVLVDCGLFQGLKELRLRNWSAPPVEPRSIGAVVLTHAHLDHSGYLPRLVKDGFAGPIHATRATADLLRILLPDSGHLNEEEAAFHNRHGTSKHAPALPLYTAEEGLAAASRVTGAAYGAPVPVVPAVSATFARAGHILGSSSLGVEIGAGTTRRRIVFSGDVGRYGAPILPDPAPIGEADYVLVESTYGDRLHDREPIADQLERLVTAAAARGGAIIVPSFAVGRTQELMYHLHGLEKAGRIPRLRTYLDSPMAIDATRIYCEHPEDFDGAMRERVLRGDNPLADGDVHLVRTPEESRALNDIKGPFMIIAASGMATGGRVLHHLKLRLPDPRTTVLLVGYQAPGTRGWLLQEGAKSVKIHGEQVAVGATIQVVHGLSAHADAEGLMRWLKTATRPPRSLFVVHGELAPAKALAERVRTLLGWAVSVPEDEETVTLE